MAKKETTLNDMLRGVSENLRRAAAAPNVYNYQPHPKQESFHSGATKGRLYIGGNRSGKTVGGIVEDIWWLTGKHPYRRTPPPPIRGRIVGVDFTSGIEKILRPIMAQWLPLSEIKGGSWEKGYNKELRTLTLANGSFVEFMSYDQALDKFAGTSRHFVHFDEEPPQDIFTECKARLIDTEGDWWITMTPVEGMTWVFDDVYDPGYSGRDRNIQVIEVDMEENPYISKAEIDLFISGLGADDRKARKQGKFVQIGGLVYKTFDTDIHVVDDFIPPLDWEWYISLDHGYNNPTAVLWHAVSPEGQIVTFSEHYEAEKTVEYHASVIHTRNAAFGRSPDIYCCDPSLSQRNAITGTSILDEYARLEIPFVLANNDIKSGIAIVQKYLAHQEGHNPTWHVTRNCQKLIWEMGRLRWKTWANKRVANQNNKYDIINKKDDHACDALRYFFTVAPDLSGVGNTWPPTQQHVFPSDYGIATHQSVTTDWQLGTRAIDRNPEGAYDDSVGYF